MVTVAPRKEAKVCRTSKSETEPNSASTKTVRSRSADGSNFKVQRPAAKTAVKLDKPRGGAHKDSSVTSRGDKNDKSGDLVPSKARQEVDSSKRVARSQSLDGSDVTGTTCDVTQFTDDRKSVGMENGANKEKINDGGSLMDGKNSGMLEPLTYIEDGESLVGSSGNKSNKSPGRAETDSMLDEAVHHRGSEAVTSAAAAVSLTDNESDSTIFGSEAGKSESGALTESNPGETGVEREGSDEMEGRDDGCLYELARDVGMVHIANRSRVRETRKSGVGCEGSTSGASARTDAICSSVPVLSPDQLLRSDRASPETVSTSGEHDGKLIVREMPRRTYSISDADEKERGDGIRLASPAADAPTGKSYSAGSSSSSSGTKSVFISNCCEHESGRTSGTDLPNQSHPVPGLAGTSGAEPDASERRREATCNLIPADDSAKLYIIHGGNDDDYDDESDDVIKKPEIIDSEPDVDDDVDRIDEAGTSGHVLRDATYQSAIRQHLSLNVEAEGDLFAIDDKQRHTNPNTGNDVKSPVFYARDRKSEEAVLDMTSPSSVSDMDDDNDSEIESSIRHCIRMSYDDDDDVDEATSENTFGQKLFDKMFDKNNFLEAECEKLLREKSVLAELLATKKEELEESNRQSKNRGQELEEENQRLKSEKNRLLDALKMPECDRVSLLTSMENEIAELKRELDEWEGNRSNLVRENYELKEDIRDLELEIQEMHDQFNKEESVELRELRKELEHSARDCRLLHFKMRKAERRSEQLRLECDENRERIRELETDGRKTNVEKKRRIEELEDQLREAREVSIKLHDECERMELECTSYRTEILGLKKMLAGHSSGKTSQASVGEVSVLAWGNFILINLFIYLFIYLFININI